MFSLVQLFAIPWIIACQTPQSMGILQARISRGSSNPGVKPRSPTLQVDSLLSEPPGKPKNTGKGSLSLLKGIFPTQESNQGLLNCRWILYQLSHQGSSKNCLGYNCNNTHETCKLGFWKPHGSQFGDLSYMAGHQPQWIQLTMTSKEFRLVHTVDVFTTLSCIFFK